MKNILSVVKEKNYNSVGRIYVPIGTGKYLREIKEDGTVILTPVRE